MLDIANLRHIFEIHEAGIQVGPHVRIQFEFRKKLDVDEIFLYLCKMYAPDKRVDIGLVMNTIAACQPELEWYPLRVTYSRELKVREILDNEGVECFIPMTVKTETVNGQRIRKTVPAINNLCFARGSRTMLETVFLEKGMKEYVSFIWERATRKPIVVRDKAMADFIKVSETRYEDIVFLLDVSSKLRAGQRVRVMSGPFAGVEGIVVRVKRSRRVMVELPGMLAVATGYIPDSDLEILEKETGKKL